MSHIGLVYQKAELDMQASDILHLLKFLNPFPSSAMQKSGGKNLMAKLGEARWILQSQKMCLCSSPWRSHCWSSQVFILSELDTQLQMGDLHPCSDPRFCISINMHNYRNTQNSTQTSRSYLIKLFHHIFLLELKKIYLYLYFLIGMSIGMPVLDVSASSHQFLSKTFI